MTTAAFVLAGGASRRMGQDKALLEFQGTPLLLHLAQMAGKVFQRVTIVGGPDAPEKYGHLHLPVVVDFRPGLGPLAGIEAALSSTFAADHNLILACDLLLPDTQLLQALLSARPAAQIVIPRTPDDRRHPLAARWSLEALPFVRAALDAQKLRVLDAIATLDCEILEVERVANANTPDEWRALTA